MWNFSAAFFVYTSFVNKRLSLAKVAVRWSVTKVDDMEVEVFDPVADYAELMEQLFDFDAIRALIAALRAAGCECRETNAGLPRCRHAR